MAQMRIVLLQAKRNGVVKSSIDTHIGKSFLNQIAILDSDNVQMVVR